MPDSGPSLLLSPFVSSSRRTLAQRLLRWPSRPKGSWRFVCMRDWPHLGQHNWRQISPRRTKFPGLRGGSRRPSASTSTRARGMPPPATGTREGCSFCVPPGWELEGRWITPATGLQPARLVISFTALGSSGSATAAPGASGAPLEPAGFGRKPQCFCDRMLGAIGDQIVHRNPRCPIHGDGETA